MPDHDFSWMKRPAVFETADVDALKPPANTPIGHRRVDVAKIFEELDYLPPRPHDGGMYMFVDMFYPAVQLSFSVFELYHSQTDINLRPRLYITKAPLADVDGTGFAASKNAHRLVWLPDFDAAVKFTEFITSYIFTRRAEQQAMTAEISVLPVRYPSDDAVDRKISCAYLVPYSTKGGFVHDQMASALSPYPIFKKQSREYHSGAQALSVQMEAAWRSS